MQLKKYCLSLTLAILCAFPLKAQDFFKASPQYNPGRVNGVIITGIGDCGSCSASAIADGIAFEAAGLPAAAICSDAFGVTADAMADVFWRTLFG